MNLERIRSKTGSMILKFAMPSIIAMVLTSLITIVDGFFIGNYIGKEGLAAVNLGLPILYIYLAVGIMIGVGGISIAGRLLGAGQKLESIQVFNQTAVTNMFVLILLSLLFCFALQPIVLGSGTEEAIKTYLITYYSVMIFVYPLMMLNTCFGMFIRGQGKPAVFMLVTFVSISMNIVLDYVFIAKLDFGLRGIAFASMIAVSMSTIVMVMYLQFKSTIYRLERFKFSKKVLVDSVLNGSSELIGQLSMGITMFVFNWVILKEIGTIGLAAFTVVGYASYMFSMVVVGFGQGASPLMSFCYGAEEFQLCQKVRKMTNKYVFVIGIVALILMNMGAPSYSALFLKNDVIEVIVSEGMKIFSISFLFVGKNVITSFYFTSIGRAKESAFISASRGLVILIICILILPKLFGIIGVWLVAPVTEGATLILSMQLIRNNEEKKMIDSVI